MKTEHGDVHPVKYKFNLGNQVRISKIKRKYLLLKDYNGGEHMHRSACALDIFFFSLCKVNFEVCS